MSTPLEVKEGKIAERINHAQMLVSTFDYPNHSKRIMTALEIVGGTFLTLAWLGMIIGLCSRN